MCSKAIAVMASGNGSNLKVILEAVASGNCPVDVKLVLSDKKDAKALDIAREFGVPNVIFVDSKRFENRELFDTACAELISKHACQWIVLAGYMRILSPSFVHRFCNRIINIHPSLLPSFAGANAIENTLSYGAKISGCTIHLVDEILDGGVILAQAVVPVLNEDDRDLLHRRIQIEEHKLYPQILTRIVNENFEVIGRKIVWGS